ncbi:glycoside hydrolase family 68 protein [Isoptericola sp. S6320L]|uniref:glycoside hydrolase family 68 protein n=1 Tax=Isoptericola sp. S6320L TaxID=2926411 RepID=UPI001FF16234|nr:glycoside hydrolase family 68 protein [Isoptericola sp. S6320L]MCK0117624.1 glycoside hydrolase family 68 protein [Isoptericola sp. S6320L]
MSPTTQHTRTRAARSVPALVSVGALVLTMSATTTSSATAANDDVIHPGHPEPTVHTQEAYAPEDDFTARWTRADALQIRAMSDPGAPAGESSMPEQYTMPEIPETFPVMTDEGEEQIWVWDTWTLTDENSDQIAFKGWEVIFALTADAQAGYAFDERHTHARMGYFFRKAGVPADERPANGGWTYGGNVFPDGAAGTIFDDDSFSAVTEWSGSTRFYSGGRLKIFYTAVAFYRDGNDQDIKPADPRIAMTEARLKANKKGVWLTGAEKQHELLKPDGEYYQTREQNAFVNFRDPFTFEDPAHPGKTFMVFEGNTAGDRGAVGCTEEDLGYQPGDPLAEEPGTVTASGANYQMANVGLAVAENKKLTEWSYLPPILSANCVNDQTERPQIYIKDGKYYLFTITHRHTFARGPEQDSAEPRFWKLDGPDGVYGFVGDGIRSDYQPLNHGSGLALGNPTNLNFGVGTPANPDPFQTAHSFQSYSHYVMPDGLVESFIDAVGNPDVRRGGTLAPTVRLDIDGDTAVVDRSYGDDGLGGYGDIPANEYFGKKPVPRP